MTEYLIYVKHRKEWESIRGWDPYNRHDYMAIDYIRPEDPIWLHVDEDCTVTFTRKPPC